MAIDFEEMLREAAAKVGTSASDSDNASDSTSEDTGITIQHQSAESVQGSAKSGVKEQ
jgi:hypothetical protein